MNVDIYLRKSRLEEQSDQAETLKRHRDTLYKIADTMELNVGTVFEEVVSGESLYARPQMLALLEKVEAGGVDAVLCMDIDRLGRGGMRDQGLILEVFKYSSTKIITPDHTYDLNDESDEQLTEFKSFIARQEYKQITKRFRIGKLKAIQEGCFLSQAPFGYRNAVVNKKPTLELVEEESRYVNMIFDMYCEGVGCQSIAATLNAMGVRPHRTDAFSRNSIRFILRNPVYIGKVVYDRKKHVRPGKTGNAKHLTIYQPEEKWIVVDGIHPPIVTAEQFEVARRIGAERYIPPSNDGTVKSPLAGLVKCGRCGKNMQRVIMKQTEEYLICVKPDCCASVKYEYVEDVILGQLRDKLQELHTEMPERAAAGRYEAVLESIRSEISKVQKQKDNIHTLLELGEYDVETYRARMRAVTDSLDALNQQERIAVHSVEKQRRMDRDELRDSIIQVLDVYYASDAAGKNKLLKSVFERIVYYKEKKTKPHDFELEFFYR